MSSSSPPPTGPSLPLHLVGLDAEGRLLHHKRGPGRPRRVERAPDGDGLAYAAATRAALAAHVAADPLVVAVQARAEGATVLRSALIASATEQAAISWELEQRPIGREAERARSRRLDALVAVARLVQQVALAEQGAPPPGVVERVREMWLRDVALIAADVLAPEDAAALIEGARARISGDEAGAGLPK